MSFYLPLTRPQDDLPHDAAVIWDTLRHGIGVGIDDLNDDCVPPGYYKVANGYMKKVANAPLVLDPSPPTIPQAAPLTMSTGGHFESAAPFLPGRIAPPLTPSGGGSGGQDSGARSRRRGLARENRFYQLEPITDIKFMYPNASTPGYTVAFMVESLRNIEQFRTLDAANGPVWDPINSDGDASNELKANLVIDTAAGDSWLFSDLAFNELRKLGPDWNLREVTGNIERVKALYEKKFFFPMPPRSMQNPEQTTILQYGLPPNLLQITLVQTVAKLILPGRSSSRPEFPFFPIGVVTGSDARTLTRFDDGLLGLGRGTFLKTYFSNRAIWQTLPFHYFAWRHKMIESAKFFISIGHPKFDKDLSRTDYIVFGAYFNPMAAKGDRKYGESDFTSMEVYIGRTLLERQEGKWLLSLHSIEFIAGDNRIPPFKFKVELIMIVDTGSAQSYFNYSTCELFRQLLVDRLGAPGMGVAPWFHTYDQLRFEFDTSVPRRNPDGSEVYVTQAISGQAKRFFVTPYSTDNPPQTNLGVSGSVFILGLNFFRTFVVGFNESVRPPRIDLLPHPYADG